MYRVNWQYVKDPNEINSAIEEKKWEGLNDASQIISVAYDHNHGCYVVFWRVFI